MSAADTVHDLRGTRARFAYGEVAGWSTSMRKAATTRVQGLPIEVRLQGLLVTLAGLTAGVEAEKTAERPDRETADGLLGAGLSRWLLRDSPLHADLLHFRGEPVPRELLRLAAEADRATHGALQAEAIRWFEQVKLFASALKEEDR